MLLPSQISNIARIRDIGTKVGLVDDRLHLYTAYVYERFPQANDHYTEEWAYRFLNREEYERSDLHGRTFLDTWTGNGQLVQD